MFVRSNWSIEELKELYALPLFDLISKANFIHSKFHLPSEVQVCSIISIKTGGCPEDCKYCAQSSRYQTSVSAQPMMHYDGVLRDAKKALQFGATRICLSAAWKGVRDGKQFDEVLRMIKGITALGLEVCCTLGQVNASQAEQMKEAGLYAYNHNIDTSENFYKTIITSRTFQDRLSTLNTVQKANLQVCCGGILGLGETSLDRLEFLLVLGQRNPHPASVPINRLSQIPGTPLEHQPVFSIWEMVRIIAIARIVLPKAMVRLSAGRIEMSYEEQALCFLAGANSIFAGEKLLTVANTPLDKDEEMFKLLGLQKRPPFVKVK
ncbi:MAG: biotin synthase BioB [Candidatus Protochlamydia sp.]|nr:biotin synthase BioB [Candidatus Protochlamydia sp.]